MFVIFLLQVKTEMLQNIFICISFGNSKNAIFYFKTIFFAQFKDNFLKNIYTLKLFL